MFIGKELLKLIYPHKCMLCRSVLLLNEEDYFCTECYDDFFNLQSEGIKSRILMLEEKRRYEEEQLTDHEEDQVIALFPHTGKYQKAVLRWKYGGIRKYARGYAQLAVRELRIFEMLPIDTIVPVPLSPQRYRKRGFNQALDLAEEIGKLANIRVYNCLERCRNTKPQTSCDRAQRYENVKGSIIFKSKTVLEDINNVLLIDDIYTTGSTVKECIKAMKEQYSFRNAWFYVLVVDTNNFFYYGRNSDGC